MAQPDADFSRFLGRQSKAELAFVLGDPAPRIELWSRREPLSLFGAFGMYEADWDRLVEIFTAVSAGFSEVSDFRYEIEVAEMLGEMAYTVGYERFRGSMNGRPVEQVEVRVTHAYRREDGEWKIVHRHGDSPNLSRAPRRPPT